MSERDPLEELRHVWRALDAPDPTPEVADAETEAVVASLRSAWCALEPPPAELPRCLHVQIVRHKWPDLMRLAAALLFLVGGAVVVRALLSSGEPAGPETTMAQLPHELPEVAPQVHTRTVESAAIENGIVMTHGKVRLVMLTPEPILESLEETHDLENAR